MKQQLLTVAAAAPRVHIASPEQNAREMLSLADQNLINNENNPLTIER